MTDLERDAILSIALLAAFADGNNEARERDEIRRIADALQGETGVNTAAIYQNVLLKKTTLESATALISSSDAAMLAYEFAVGVCDADGAHSPAEKAFLDRLRDLLKLDKGATETVATQAAQLAAAPVAVAAGAAGVAGAAAGAYASTASAGSNAASSAQQPLEPPLAATMTQAELDKMILNYSILNGALELLPQSIASMAIIPLQMKMVYRIGKAHGFELDKGHIKDFLAALGVGLTSQYVEQFGRRLVGGLFGKVAGGIGRSAGSMITGSAFSFATTYALGHVAKRYYAGGRSLSADSLKQAFSGVLGEAKQLQTKYLPDIQQRARTIDVSQIMKEVAR
ncbi:MAG: TerB family tellurite resistance protein [Burkholderiales bacterium]